MHAFLKIVTDGLGDIIITDGEDNEVGRLTVALNDDDEVDERKTEVLLVAEVRKAWRKINDVFLVLLDNE